MFQKNKNKNEEADKAARNAISISNSVTLPLMSLIDLIKNVDKYCIQDTTLGLKLAPSYRQHTKRN